MTRPEQCMSGITIEQAIRSVKASPEYLNYTGWVSLHELVTQVLGIHTTTKNDQSRIKECYVPGATWICSDTRVGVSIIFIDDEPVALTTQQARKSDYTIYYIDDLSRIKLNAFCLSVIDWEYNSNSSLWPYEGIPTHLLSN